MALYKSVYYYYFLAHQHKACRQLKIKQEMTAVGYYLLLYYYIYYYIYHIIILYYYYYKNQSGFK